jgi:hypothetical protein
MLPKQRKQTFFDNKDGGVRFLHIVCKDTSKKRLKHKGIEINFMNTLRHPVKTNYCRENKQTLDQTADLIDDDVVKFLLCANTNYGFSCRNAYRHASHVILQIGSVWFLFLRIWFVLSPFQVLFREIWLVIFSYNVYEMNKILCFYLYLVLSLFMAGFNANFMYDFRKIIALSALKELGLIVRILSVGFPLLHFTVFNPCLI